MKTARLAVRAASWAAALAFAAGANAQEAVGGSVTGSSGAAIAEQAAHSVDLGPGLSDTELAGQSGGADLHLNELNAKAIVSENYAGNLATGNNAISDGAFVNSAGVPMVVQNTGNNVSIQNSTILNLKLH